jgi:serine/threonine protein kinase
VLHHYNGDFTPFHNTIQAHPKFRWLETEFMREQTTFVILPYIPHTLQSFVNEVLDGHPERLPERGWLWIALQLFRAVAYLNTQHIVHRDIKADG